MFLFFVIYSIIFLLLLFTFLLSGPERTPLPLNQLGSPPALQQGGAVELVHFQPRLLVDSFLLDAVVDDELLVFVEEQQQLLRLLQIT